jgi:hypothetical protein
MNIKKQNLFRLSIAIFTAIATNQIFFASPASAREDTVFVDPSYTGDVCIELYDTSYNTNISVQWGSYTNSGNIGYLYGWGTAYIQMNARGNNISDIHVFSPSGTRYQEVQYSSCPSSPDFTFSW